MFTENEIAEDVDKLIKMFLEMKSVTRYKNQEEFNIQRLSLWVYNVKKRKGASK